MTDWDQPAEAHQVIFGSIRGEIRELDAYSDTEKATEILEAILDLHQPEAQRRGGFCAGCRTAASVVEWPCRTVSLMVDALPMPVSALAEHMRRQERKP